MTPQERKSLAEQLLTNPLFTATLEDMERSAVERLIYAKDDTAEAQLRVQAIRTFRQDLEQALNTQPRKGAPA